MPGSTAKARVRAAPRGRERGPSAARAVATRAPKVGFVSLGCPKALVDSERILTQLRAEGYEVSPTYEAADVVVVNTCGFIDAAVDESLDAIGEALEHNGKVIVTGCLGAKPERILARHPRVLKVTGPHAYEDVVGAVHEHLPPRHEPFFDLLPPQGVRLTPRHYAYLKIAEGCNNKCSFCIIPDMRGRLLDLARGLAQLGIWVRLHYVYPYPHVDAVIPFMAERRILPYLDIPFQHGSATVLKRMRRPAHAENTLARLRAWRAVCPDLTLRSTFIVGFPGETASEFQELLDWLDEAQLDRVGCFKYSPVEGAAANALPGHVPPAVQEERFARFMERAAAISTRRLAARVGKRMRVLVDSVTDDGAAIARSAADAPQIDGVVRIAAGQKNIARLKVGDWADVEIVASDSYDLTGRLTL